MSKIAVAAAAASVPFSSTVIGDGGLVQRPVDQDPLFFRDAAEERLVGTEGKPRAQTFQQVDELEVRLQAEARHRSARPAFRASARVPRP